MAAHAAPTSTAQPRAITWSRVTDAVTYWMAIAGVYIAYGFLWFYSAKEKLFDQNGTMPAGLAKSYSGSFIDSFPGVNTAWLLLGLLEAVALGIVVASLATGEFLPQRRKPILLAGLAVSMFTFALMSFAQNMIANFDSVASLFTYIGVTAVVFALIRYVPPFRGERTGS
jgi:hypothetical protein